MKSFFTLLMIIPINPFHEPLANLVPVTLSGVSSIVNL